MQTDNTPEAITPATPEQEAEKLGVTVEQYWLLDRDVRDMKLSGKFPECGLFGKKGCTHLNAPCLWSTMKAKPPLDVPVLLARIRKLASEVMNERYLLLLGKPKLVEDFATHLHKERMRQDMLDNKDPRVSLLARISHRYIRQSSVFMV